MSEPTYGSGPAYDPQQGYGGAPGWPQQAKQYGGQPGPQYGTGQQPQQPAPQPQYGSYAQPQPQPQPGPAGYPSGDYRAASSGSVPAAPRTPADRLGLVATVVTIVGYVCAGAGVLGFVLWLTVDGNGTYRFATALQTLVVGIGLGGLNYAVGSWLATRGDGAR
jgi:hypothetical protein